MSFRTSAEGAPLPPVPGSRRTRHRRRAALACALLVAAAWWLHGSGDGFFYWPDAHVHETPSGYGLQVETVAFAAPGGPSLAGWWARSRGEALGTVVYCHGNHANVSLHARFVAWLPARGFHLLLFDYRGYGESQGRPSREGSVEDTLAAIDYALARDPDRVVVFGHSLGGAVGIVAAARRKAVRAVAAESSFPSYRAAARCTVPALGFLMTWLVSAGLDPIDALPDLAARPLLVIHGTGDRITPLELGRELFAAAAEPKCLYLVEGGGHGSPSVTQGSRFEDELCRFFAAAIAR